MFRDVPFCDLHSTVNMSLCVSHLKCSDFLSKKHSMMDESYSCFQNIWCLIGTQCTFVVSSHEEFGWRFQLRYVEAIFLICRNMAGRLLSSCETTCAVVHPGFSLDWLFFFTAVAFALVFFCGFAFSSFFLLLGFPSLLWTFLFFLGFLFELFGHSQ